MTRSNSQNDKLILNSNNKFSEAKPLNRYSDIWKNLKSKNNLASAKSEKGYENPMVF